MEGGSNKLKKRGWGDTYDGIEWIIVNGEWIGRDSKKYNHVRGKKGDSYKSHLLIYSAKGLLLLSLMMMTLRIIIALSKDTAADDLGNKVDISEMACNEDEFVSGNGISDSSVFKTADLNDDEVGSKTGRKRRRRNIRIPYKDFGDDMDDGWIDWY